MPWRSFTSQETNIIAVTSAFGADFSFDYQWGYPALTNNRQMFEIIRQAGQRIIGRQRLLTVAAPSMGAEDFACFISRVPGAYFFLGAKPPEGETYPWHNPKFRFDESALATGAALLAGCVVQAQEVWGKEGA